MPYAAAVCCIDLSHKRQASVVLTYHISIRGELFGQLQVHTIGELQRVLQLKLDRCMLGINNRDLSTFKVDLQNNKVIMDSPAGKEVSRPAFCDHRIAMSCLWVFQFLQRGNVSDPHNFL